MPGMQCGGDIGFRRPNGGGFETLCLLQSGRKGVKNTRKMRAQATDLEMKTVAFPGAQGKTAGAGRSDQESAVPNPI